ncbi:fatty acid desaturase [Vitiosangium sp. GDMCC 1.1324]|uniref:fatty acid desaturase family protein n=1 Tax=Vitiosangium sp. (strain GDMCC 1.1324) TaxID=2138576 RepID=UPI000D3B5EE2|nr:fatty acid desaturase [Vitiosangium sp. GDMCC 1.1324]PTL79273.1 fatty acid desaturase [Vitiosangium sp. GDMCC 1.1324]
MAPAQLDSSRRTSDGTTPASRERSTSVAARLRATYAREVARMGNHAHSPAAGIGHMAFHLGLGVGAALGAHALLETWPGAGWVLYPLVAFFIATRFRALGNMLHEACHGMFVKGKRANRVFGHALAIIDLTALEPYTREHFTHHQHLGDPERDLDFMPRRKFGFAESTEHFARRHLLRPLTLVHLPSFVRPVLFSRTDPWPVTLSRWAFYAGLLTLAQWGVGWKAFGLFYLLPYFVAYQVIRYWSDAVDHAGIIGSADEFHRSRNHIFKWGLLNRVLFPRNDQYHLTHHLFPAVPTTTQGRVHALLLKDPEYADRPHAFSALL